jgi:anti-anti-sigma factor
MDPKRDDMVVAAVTRAPRMTEIARMTVHDGPGAKAGMPVVTLAGPVDRELIERVHPMLQLLTLEHDGPIVIDVSSVDAVNGALLGLLLRATRRLAWRNRQLIIACCDPENSRRLRIAGLDELATLVESVTPASSAAH